MISPKREASLFGLSWKGDDEKHMDYEKIQSNFLFTKLSVNVNICHQVTQKGPPLCRTLMACPIPLLRCTLLTSAALTERKGGLSGFWWWVY